MTGREVQEERHGKCALGVDHTGNEPWGQFAGWIHVTVSVCEWKADSGCENCQALSA